MTNKKSLKIITIGDINADLSFMLHHLPAAGDDVVASGLHWSGGGAGLNSALAFSRLGGAVWLIGRVGNDPAAEVALQAVRQAGVELRLVQHDSSLPTGLCGVLVTANGERSLLSYRGANVACDPLDLSSDLMRDTDLLSISGHALLEGPQQATTLHAIELAEEHNVPVALDLCLLTIRAAGPLLLDLLPQLWLLTLNEEELRALLPGLSFQWALEQLLERGAHHVAIKRGAQGCTILEGEQRLAFLPPVVQVVDTTACGDAFSAGYAWALLRGAPLPARATLANLMGALTASKPGAAAAIPSRIQLFRRLDARLHYLLNSR
ncbi:MAG: carbohydrate kinase family protein [Candidatus Viridilinea halotolerans]|uniref:Carbohydrate kinase family protein n=1 Tax=Candidatus Viridilinea halotolerans TaxID=2491704 RepID=A0A426U0Z4_9CHLR|nr:MAG: carbohydrate kinase family protein [Candidatus Viridilinea halotolerans]